MNLWYKGKKSSARFLLPLAGILSGITGGIAPQTAKAQGWVPYASFPTNLVSLNSGKRNNIFYIGQPVTFTLQGASAVRYEVRDYWGNVVDQGPASATIAPKVTAPGWYKLYLHGTPVPATLGDSVGGTTFVIFRDKSGFPASAVSTAPGSTYAIANDELMRGITGMGPQRHYVSDAGQPDAAIAALEGDIAMDEQVYLPYDPARNRKLLIAFPNGTQNLAGVQKIVMHFKDRVTYWEPRNEPNGGSNGTDFVNKELIPFYKTIKSISPKLKVLGPGVGSVGPQMLAWIADFLEAGGAKYIDGFSFHAYNNVNGDFSLARTSLDNLNSLLAKYGADKIEKWQTEQGYFAAYYGAYAPRHQGRWTMTMMMAFEQYGIPKEHNNLWYDVSHGFWDFPSWTENNDGSLNPAGALMRVWSEELQGVNYVSAFNMGATGDKQYTGSLFQGTGKSVAVFMSAGGTDGQVTLNVSGGSTVHVVSAFGKEQDLPILNGQVTLPVPELPVYVEIVNGQSISVAPIDWGRNLALQPGVKVVASGQSVHPLWPTADNGINKLVNDQLENWYYTQVLNDHPWMSNVSSFPATVEVDLPSKQTVNRVAIYCPVPWQFDGSLLDYDLQYDNNGTWVTVSTAKEATNILAAFTPTMRCTLDSFYSDRNLFTHTFAPVTTAKLRLYVRDATWGGGPVKAFNDAQGYSFPHQINVREIEIYSPISVNRQYNIGGTLMDLTGKPLIGVPITLSGWQSGQTKTDAHGSYSFMNLEAGRSYTVAPQVANLALTPNLQTVDHLYSNQTLNFLQGNIAATFVNSDARTAGNWVGTYGNNGYNIIGDAAKNPTNIVVTATNQQPWNWANSTGSLIALQKASLPHDRIAACWYTCQPITLDVQISDTSLHQMSLYLLDWDVRGRTEKIEVLNGITGAVMSTQTVAGFTNGKYMTWNVRGHVKFRITCMTGCNAVVSGIFFDPVK